ncbi:MAG: DNA repair protein RadA, partial [Acidimicrobiia bacterium]|nr:DNA repair protein RadA [Acidimicrobiia bacterium]
LVASTPAGRPVPIAEVDAIAGEPRPTGITEFDRVLSGGLVPGSVTLVGGEPGIGKSTLLLQVAHSWPGSVLYVCAEESAQQVRHRAERLGSSTDGLWLLPETDLASVVAGIDEVSPSLLVIDSVQTVADPALPSAAGSVAQVRAVTQRLVSEAKRRDLPVVLVGHVTKEGDLAGPRVLEHLVDTVITFEGDRHHALRLVRAVKHRFGSTNDLSVFEMAGDGLRGVDDPSHLFLADRRPGVPGSVVTPTLEGRRPIVVEIQALTTPAPPGVPARRTSQGVDPARLALLLAVLTRHAGVRMHEHDVYVSTVGGVRLTEPGVDLSIALAVVSAVVDRPLPPGLAVFGEVGLGGEIRQASHPDRRVAEAERLGCDRILVPERTPGDDASSRLVRVDGIVAALRAADLID